MTNDNNDSAPVWSSIDTTSSNTTYTDSQQAKSRGRQLFSRRGDSSDEIDPRKLVRDPSISELRWYYRRTFAKTLVDKPIDDAFKNGFELDGREADRANAILDDTEYIENYKLAHKHARKDGFSLLHIQTRDNSMGLWQSPMDDGVFVAKIIGTKVLTIDDLCYCAEGEIFEEVQEAFGLTQQEFLVRKTGIVVNNDPQSPDFRDPIGYVLDLGNHVVDGDNVQFIHKDRVQHFTWNPEVSGDFKSDNTHFSYDTHGHARFRDTRPLGEWEGDSVLVQSYDLLKGIAKGNWAIMQALFRNAANMYTVSLPEDADEEDFAEAFKSFQNMNAKSEYVLPDGYEVKQHQNGDMMEPREHFDVVFDQILASHEMTKSVLFGTQSGVVSGSETDIKNYFNKVERFREGRSKREIHDFLNRAKNMLDGRVKDARMDVDIEFGPLFRLSKEQQLKMFLTDAQALTMMINGYMITPDEARSILSEEWARVDMDGMSEEQMDILDRINLTQVGAWEGAERNEPDTGNSFQGNNSENGGGNQQGNQQSEFADAETRMDGLVDKLADKVLDRVNEKLEEEM
ncbi:portal protein [Haloarcula tailed virus 2]|uniref:Portal protein n=1 Tax=Haloarcula tailed virus 2 TaxID=2877989 RepID=A0AAE8XYV6_9CAUD|nr:portal protein [Haloarcula tailed virus 2]UBF23160.1 portal protein [Haloarcula tailed virus 2]